MQTRREFIDLAARLAGGAGAMGGFLESIASALAIEPAAGSSYLDAEHVVILMQENRSFDHAYGTLRGVRGFNDPRAITLPDGNPVWVQPNLDGEHYAPFRFDIKNSKVTWMGSLPHDRGDQIDARNHGLHDRWLNAKQSGQREYAKMPLTMGFFTREDIPFYYALADAFTICDQYFCSSLTATTPNRLHLWTGTVRAKPSANSPANVRNDDVDLDHLASWPTFQERLQDLGVSWKVYQNELTVQTGLSEEEDAWLANFGDNPLEYFKQYHAHLAPNHLAFVEKRIKELPGEIHALEKQLTASGGSAAERGKRKKDLENLKQTLRRYEAEHADASKAGFAKLSPREQALHQRAFAANAGDPGYRQLVELAYRDGNSERRLRVPKGDVLSQFRKDVETGNLPKVSWLVSPETFSDHPSSAWFGAWYIAEVLNILTSNPNVWKKTIFMLTYDENDGYFDHVPPFVVPDPRRPETGKVTKGIDAAVEYVTLAQDRKMVNPQSAREGPIGLGYRVPMVIASPWSRGGCVCSQVFDHTSVLQFLEKFLSHKLGKKVEETNITRWRRAISGDLTASFQTPSNQAEPRLKFPPRDEFLEMIHKAKFKELPGGYHALTSSEAEQIRRDPKASPLLPRQEEGVRPSCPLPYELHVDGALDRQRTHFAIHFEARNEMFRERAAGAPFIVYAVGAKGGVKVRNYAVEAGQTLADSWALADFEGGRYYLRVYGPNGFFREFKGGVNDPLAELNIHYSREPSNPGQFTGGVEISANNLDGQQTLAIDIQNHALGSATHTHPLKPNQRASIQLEPHPSGWYDFTVCIAGASEFKRRYAGRVETGKWSTSDPAMA